MIQVVSHKIQSKGFKKPKGYKALQLRQVNLIQSIPPVAAVYAREQEMPSDLSGTVKTSAKQNSTNRPSLKKLKRDGFQ